MKKIKYIAVAIALLCSTGVFAQWNPATLKIDYSVGIPTGSFKDVIGNTSFKGFGAELMFHVNDNLSLGLETGSQYYYQKYPRDIYKQSDGSAISAVVSNTVQTVPIMFKAQYNFMTDKIVQPYVALAAGGNIISYNQYAGQYSNDQKNKFGFAARPEAGVFVPFRKNGSAGISLGAGYSFMPFNYNGISNLNSITARAGISIPLGD
ncbi:MAG: outer membrane beta-barrel protein [Chitinophagaceae bacterium]